MAERDWRPRDAAERARGRERLQGQEQAGVQPEQADKDALFTSEEAINYDRDVVKHYDPANDTWVPHQPRTPD